MSELLDPFGWLGAVVAEKYRVDDVVGEGGFGVVYRAFHLGFQERVALKCLKVPERIRGSEKTLFEDTFLEEGRLLHKLSRATAGIVQALDVGTASSPSGVWTPYLVLEWLDGSSLEANLAVRKARGEGGRSLAEAMALLGPAARAIGVAHRQGVAHRDIKPPNLFLTDVGGAPTMKVLDFGIAKVMTESPSLTRAYQETGASIRAFSAGYGAPEQFNPDLGATGPWTDVFALALVLVELLSGVPALRGVDTMQLYVQASDRTQRPTPRSRGVAVSDEVEAVLARALAVEPRERHRNADELWEELVRAADASVSSTAADAPRISATVPSSPLGAFSAVHGPPVILDAVTGPTGDTTLKSLVAPVPPPRSSGVAPSARRTRSYLVGGVVVVAAFATLGALSFTRRTARTPTLPAAVEAPSGGLGSAPAAAAPSPPEGMVFVAPATFVMGEDTGSQLERPAHQVTISRSFFLDLTEVPAGAYEACVTRGGCTPSGIQREGRPDLTADPKYSRMCNAGRADRRDHPINCVGQAQAQSFCAFAGKRLPTEAEWELAARGTDGRRYAWGNAEPTCALAMFSACGIRLDGLAYTRPVGSFPEARAASGALDMSGNVWEWVADTWDPGIYARGAQTDPVSRSPSAYGILRGGSWDFAATHLTTTVRTKFALGDAHVSTGFRCAKDAG